MNPLRGIWHFVSGTWEGIFNGAGRGGRIGFWGGMIAGGIAGIGGGPVGIVSGIVFGAASGIVVGAVGGAVIGALTGGIAKVMRGGDPVETRGRRASGQARPQTRDPLPGHIRDFIEDLDDPGRFNGHAEREMARREATSSQIGR